MMIKIKTNKLEHKFYKLNIYNFLEAYVYVNNKN